MPSNKITNHGTEKKEQQKKFWNFCSCTSCQATIMTSFHARAFNVVPSNLHIIANQIWPRDHKEPDWPTKKVRDCVRGSGRGLNLVKVLRLVQEQLIP